MKLIDGDALKKKLQARRNNSEEDFDRGFDAGIGVAMNLILNAPTVEQFDDTELQRAIGYADGYSRSKTERPQGEWELVTDDKVNLEFIYRCSECGREVSIYNTSRLTEIYPFCHCGADMRGGNTSD